MLKVLRTFFSIPIADYSDDEILHICGILFVNGHEVPVTTSPSQAIFRSASLVEHSCVNNASKHFDMNCNIQVIWSWPLWIFVKSQAFSVSMSYWQVFVRAGNFENSWQCVCCLLQTANKQVYSNSIFRFFSQPYVLALFPPYSNPYPQFSSNKQKIPPYSFIWLARLISTWEYVCRIYSS